MEDDFHFPGLPLTYLDLPWQSPGPGKLQNWTLADCPKMVPAPAPAAPPVTSRRIELPVGQLKKIFHHVIHTALLQEQ